LKRLIASAGTVVSTLAIAGCASYDQAQTKDSIVNDLSPQVKRVNASPIESADCPADVEIEKGTEFNCTATLKDGTEVEVVGAVVNDEGSIQVDISDEALAELAGTT
jgi:hypothetical protein